MFSAALDRLRFTSDRSSSSRSMGSSDTATAPALHGPQKRFLSQLELRLGPRGASGAVAHRDGRVGRVARALRYRVGRGRSVATRAVDMLPV